MPADRDECIVTAHFARELAAANAALAEARRMISEINDENERLSAELAAMEKQRDEARRWLRDACAEIARIETRFYDALTPQQIAERNGWNCFGEKEGGGA